VALRVKRTVDRISWNKRVLGSTPSKGSAFLSFFLLSASFSVPSFRNHTRSVHPQRRSSLTIPHRFRSLSCLLPLFSLPPWRRRRARNAREEVTRSLSPESPREWLRREPRRHRRHPSAERDLARNAEEV
jgi:hypothetical protein